MRGPDRLEALAAEIVNGLVTVGLPAIAAHSSDEAILEAGLAQPGHDYRKVDVVGILLVRLGGSADQRTTFRDVVAAARRFRLRYDDELRPPQGPKRVAANLIALHDDRAERRAQAAHLLGRAKPAVDVVEALQHALGDPDIRVRGRAAASLADVGEVSRLPRILAMMRGDLNRYELGLLAHSLRRLARRDPSTRTKIVEALHDRYSRAIGQELVDLGAALEQLGEPV